MKTSVLASSPVGVDAADRSLAASSVRQVKAAQSDQRPTGAEGRPEVSPGVSVTISKEARELAASLSVDGKAGSAESSLRRESVAQSAAINMYRAQTEAAASAEEADRALREAFKI
ncbi:MAG: hypothetical protein ACO3JL_01235 [Myxococcota bacterium]